MPLSRITADSIADGTIVAADIADGSVTGSKLGLTAINANNIVNGTITGAKIASATITGNNIAVGQITGNLLTANCVTGNNIVANVSLTDPVITGTIQEDIFTITDGAAFEIDPGNGSIQLITLGASRTPKATNFVAGESVILMVDDGTAYALTWTDTTFGTSGVVWKTNAAAAPTLNTSGYTVITLWKVGTQVYGARVGDA
jgi:hypothetical protein